MRMGRLMAGLAMVTLLYGCASPGIRWETEGATEWVYKGDLRVVKVKDLGDIDFVTLTVYDSGAPDKVTCESTIKGRAFRSFADSIAGYLKNKMSTAVDGAKITTAAGEAFKQSVGRITEWPDFAAVAVKHADGREGSKYACGLMMGVPKDKFLAMLARNLKEAGLQQGAEDMATEMWNGLPDR